MVTFSFNEPSLKMSRAFSAISKANLLLSMNKTAHPISEQHIHLLGFYNGSYLAFAEHQMH
jgi:hypothetical protein